MLGKLAYRNTKRNIKDYLIYLITVTASFSLIFAFNLVASSDEIVKLCSSMDAFKNSLFAVNILIIFVICFLINYTTKFMFEKRSKELGTYMLLGIKKKEIAHLVIIENILLGILAFVLAIASHGDCTPRPFQKKASDSRSDPRATVGKVVLP